MNIINFLCFLGAILSALAGWYDIVLLLTIIGLAYRKRDWSK